MDKDFLENERKIDLSSIKKIDKTIVHILDKTDKVASYKFDGTAWVRYYTPSISGAHIWWGTLYIVHVNYHIYYHR